MEIEICEMLKFFLHKIRRIERKIRFVLKTNKEATLYSKINFDITQEEMEDRIKKSFDRFNKFKNFSSKGIDRKFPKKKEFQKNQQQWKTKKKPNQAPSREQHRPQENIKENITVHPILIINEQKNDLSIDPKMLQKKIKKEDIQSSILKSDPPKEKIKNAHQKRKSKRSRKN